LNRFAYIKAFNEATQTTVAATVPL